MSTPSQMFDHELNATKGWPSPYAVDTSAVMLLESGQVAHRGQVASLNPAGQLQLGLECAAMPIFLLQNSYDFDVAGDDYNLVGNGSGLPNMSGLVAIGAYELESTEYDKTETYNPNNMLTAGDPDAIDAGVIKKGVAYEDTICGVVSKGTFLNDFKRNVLRFWPVWLPPLACPQESSNDI